MISDCEIFFNALSKLVISKSKVCIATYNLYLGISKGKDWNEVFPMAARSFIEKCPPKNTRILVGYSSYEPKECIKCDVYNKNKDNKVGSLDIAIKTLKLNVRVLKDCHLKLYGIDEYWYVGGINIGKSNSYDLMILAPEIETKHLEEYFNRLWDLAQSPK